MALVHGWCMDAWGPGGLSWWVQLYGGVLFIFFGEQQLELGTENEGDLMQFKKEILYEV